MIKLEDLKKIDWDFAKVVVEDCGVPLETEY